MSGRRRSGGGGRQSRPSEEEAAAVSLQRSGVPPRRWQAIINTESPLMKTSRRLLLGGAILFTAENLSQYLQSAAGAGAAGRAFIFREYPQIRAAGGRDHNFRESPVTCCAAQAR